MDNELRKIISMLVGRAWLIVLGAVLGAGAAYFASQLTPPVYEASTTLLVNQAPNGTAPDYASILIKSEQLAQTYADMMTQRPVLAEAAKTLQLSQSVEDLAKMIRVELVRNTQLLVLHVESTYPVLAAAIANAVPEAFAKQNAAMQAQRYGDSKASLLKDMEQLNGQIQSRQEQMAELSKASDATALTYLARLQLELTQLQQSYSSLRQSYENIGLAEAQSTSNIVVTEPAVVPSKPVRPRTLQNTLLGGLIGLLLAVGLIFLIEYLDDRIHDPAQIEQLLKAPLIGVVALLPLNGGRANGSAPQSNGLLVALNEPRSPAAESFRGLRTNIQFADVDKPLRVVLVTSSGPGEGKSTVAANLAVVMAQAGQQVVLLDGDLRRPAAHKFLELGVRPGLTDFMLQKKDEVMPSQCMRPTKVPNLFLVSCGKVPPNPSELLSSQRMRQMLDWLQNNNYTVVVDSPPLLAVTDPVLLASQADSVLLVVEADRTRIGTVVQARRQLEQIGARVVGVVLNKAPMHQGRYAYHYRYYYHNYYMSGSSPQDERQLSVVGRQ